MSRIRFPTRTTSRARSGTPRSGDTLSRCDVRILARREFRTLLDRSSVLVNVPFLHPSGVFCQANATYGDGRSSGVRHRSPRRAAVPGGDGTASGTGGTVDPTLVWNAVRHSWWLLVSGLLIGLALAGTLIWTA